MDEAKLINESVKSTNLDKQQINWNWLLILCLALGGLMAALLYKQQMGMQWLIFVALFEICLFVLAFIQKHRIQLASILLAVINVAIALVTVFRTEP